MTFYHTEDRKIAVLKQGNDLLTPSFYIIEMKGSNFSLVAIGLVQGNQLDGYTFVEKEWGSFHYKVYNGSTQYLEAVKRCRADGGGLPVPQSV